MGSEDATVTVALALLAGLLPWPIPSSVVDDVTDFAATVAAADSAPTPESGDPLSLVCPGSYHPECGEQWRPLLQQWFNPGDVDWAVAVVGCESAGDPHAVNPTSGATGLFQHLPTFWLDRTEAAGLPGATVADMTDVSMNVHVAAYLYYKDGSSHWAASEYCWN